MRRCARHEGEGKPRPGDVQPHLARYDLVWAIVARAVETARPLLDARHHLLDVSLDAEPLLVLGDITRLSQVVGNLLNNAAKYTDEGGRVALRAERRRKVDHTLDRSQGGLGIGLALVRTLVDMHAAGRRVLVIDDNRDSAETLAVVLRLQGHSVQTAHDGVKAVAAAERFRPAMVVLDLGMPGMDGYEVARAIRAQGWGRQMLLVAQTGWGQPEDRRRAQEAGFDVHLTKPVDSAKLTALLAALDAAMPADPKPAG